jgi:hypothetical protein
MQTVQCPSCGATATNLRNCEFCGSLFVRSYENGYDISNFSQKNKTDCSFLGLKEELDKNFQLRKKYNCDYFHTEVYRSKLDWLNLTSDDGLLKVHNLSSEGVIQMNSLSIEILAKDLSNTQIEAMQSMKEYVFFEEIGVDDDRFWIINFGVDTSGAAFLLTKLLRCVFHLSDDSYPYFVTIVENLVVDTNDDIRWWVEETSEEFKERYNRAAAKFGYFSRNPNGSYNTVQKEKTGNCFIATATMGSYDHPMVVELRGFRDNWILKKSWGNKFVNWYYKYGAVLAKLIDKSILVKQICYLLIVKPLVIFSRCISVFKK